MLRGLTPRDIRAFEKEHQFSPLAVAQFLHKKDERLMGIGYGWRRRDDYEQADVAEEPGILLFVAEAGTLANSEDTPRIVGRTRVSHVVTGWIRPSAQRIHRNKRPVKGGVAIGTTPDGDSGTLACRAFRDGPNGREYFVLSCAHVLKAPGVEAGHEVIQPGLTWDGSPEGNGIGTVESSVPILFGGAANAVDAAIGRTDASFVRSGVVSVGEVRSWRRMQDIPVGLPVLKSGIAKPYVAHGTVEAIGYAGQWPFPTGVAWFTDQIVTTALAKPGDSGSLLLAKADKSAVGMVVATSDLHTISCPIEVVQRLLNVKVADEMWAPA